MKKLEIFSGIWDLGFGIRGKFIMEVLA